MKTWIMKQVMACEEVLDNIKNYEELEGFGGLEGCLVNEEKVG